MPKPFMTYDQQVQKLRDKHLVIADEAAAKDTLRQISYYALISGYKDLFKNPATKNYRDGTTFDDILALYQFDEKLRELTLSHLMHIEQHIRSLLSYAFCDKFGELQAAYLLPQNFQYTGGTNQREIDTLIKRYLKPLVQRKTDYPYIEHCKKVHQNVPLWVLVNAITFGTISKMYTLSKPQIQSVVSQEFESINERQLGQILQVMTDYRNVCAHGERLFSYKCATHDIPDLLLHKKLGIPKKGNQYSCGKRDYFAVVLSFRYLLPHEEFKSYKKQLAVLIDGVVKANQQITETELLGIMGLPHNWKTITRYRKI